MAAYSWSWQETFARRYDPALTELETAFVARQLPAGADVLDVCCGFGRHALALARLGHRVVGVERDPRVVAAARAAGVDARELDVRELDRLTGSFDGAISMWASFGSFDDAANAAVLAATARKLRPGGRLVLDVWNPPFHRTRQGERELRPGVTEAKRVEGDRMRVRLDYPGGARDELDFRLYEPAELDELGAACSLERRLLCTGFDERREPTDADPRLQLVYALAA